MVGGVVCKAWGQGVRPWLGSVRFRALGERGQVVFLGLEV